MERIGEVTYFQGGQGNVGTMYRDNTLIPSEAVRLLALGILATDDTPYAALASEVRRFTSHLAGPSLDLVASPLELLRVEGLIETADGQDLGEDARLRITDSGRQELRRLLVSNVRAPVTDINKLIIALKMRFLHLLEAGEREMQIEAIAEMCERELARLISLRDQHADAAGVFTEWLDHDIGGARARLVWFESLKSKLATE